MSLTAAVAQQKRDVRSIELAGKQAALKASAKIRAAAMAAFRSRRPQVNVTNIVREHMVEPMQVAMLTAHLQGERRSRIDAARASRGAIKAAHSFKDTVSALRKMNRNDWQRLAQRYQTQAFKVLDVESAHAEEKLRSTLADLYEAGAHITEATAVLNDAFDSLGLTPKADYALEGLFRTQSSIAYSAGKWQADQDPDVADMLWGYEYRAVGDDRTRPTHMAFDGTRLPKDDPFWSTCYPPNGFNCRCTVIGIYREESIVKPTSEIDGVKVTPDKGFDFNPGAIFAQGLAASMTFSAL